jgi:hypothetical protein
MLKVSENQDVVNKLELNESERTENTVKVLAFGNSFSNDGTSFIPQIAYADGVDLRVADCSIGGCTLAKHYDNSVTNASAYSFSSYKKAIIFAFFPASFTNRLLIVSSIPSTLL